MRLAIGRGREMIAPIAPACSRSGDLGENKAFINIRYFREICEIPRVAALLGMAASVITTTMRYIEKRLPMTPSMPWFETVAMLLLIFASHL